jgi:ribosome-associated heat shock protein Hsp15
MSAPSTSAHRSAAGVRLDKWLWAARFFKARSLAKQAIEGGKVRYDGDAAKVSKSVEIGATLRLRQGYDEVELVVRALSDQRVAAPIARLLYEETSESRERRARAALERKAASGFVSPERPSKQQRRAIHRFKREFLE